jgi:O-antigen ligase
VSTAVEQRFSVWDGSLKGLSHSPVFGGGTGGEQALINEGYASINYQEGIDNSYNAHNQYLQFLTRNGIPELLCFLALFVYAFRQSLKSPGNMFMMFNIMVLFMMFVESFLDVQKGILFFYFFLCVFLVEPNLETKIRLGSTRD